MQLAIGAIFAERYEVIRLVNHGGMGAVYEVLHLETRRRRALKVMLPDLLADTDMRERFLREARVTAEVSSENLVETFDAGIDKSTQQPFLVMELLRGEDLAQKLAREGPLPHGLVTTHLAQVAKVLDKCHQASIVHRDLKPENLFLTAREDGSHLVKVLDFGIAKVLSDSALGKSTRSIGTPLYMAPEMLGKKTSVTGAADRYALAHIAYALLVGEAYFETEGRDSETIYALLPMIAQGLAEAPSARAERSGLALGTSFDAWMERAAHTDPASRFASAHEQIAALTQILTRDPPSRLSPPGTSTRVHDPNAATLIPGRTGASVSAGNHPAKGAEATLVAAGPPRGTKDFSVEVVSPRKPSTVRTPAVFGALAVAALGTLGAWWLLRSDTLGDPNSSGTRAGVGPAMGSDPNPTATSATEREPQPAVLQSITPLAVSPATASALGNVNPTIPSSTSPKPNPLAQPLRPTASAQPGHERLPASATAKSPECATQPWRCR